MWHFQFLIVSAVKICKSNVCKLLQFPQTPYRGFDFGWSPLGDFRRSAPPSQWQFLASSLADVRLRENILVSIEFLTGRVRCSYRQALSDTWVVTVAISFYRRCVTDRPEQRNVYRTIEWVGGWWTLFVQFKDTATHNVVNGSHVTGHVTCQPVTVRRTFLSVVDRRFDGDVQPSWAERRPFTSITARQTRRRLGTHIIAVIDLQFLTRAGRFGWKQIRLDSIHYCITWARVVNFPEIQYFRKFPEILAKVRKL